MSQRQKMVCVVVAAVISGTFINGALQWRLRQIEMNTPLPPPYHYTPLDVERSGPNPLGLPTAVH